MYFKCVRWLKLERALLFYRWSYSGNVPYMRRILEPSSVSSNPWWTSNNKYWTLPVGIWGDRMSNWPSWSSSFCCTIYYSVSIFGLFEMSDQRSVVISSCLLQRCNKFINLQCLELIKRNLIYLCSSLATNWTLLAWSLLNCNLVNNYAMPERSQIIRSVLTVNGYIPSKSLSITCFFMTLFW